MIQTSSSWCDRFQSVGQDYLFGEHPNRYLESKAALFSKQQKAFCLADGEGRNAVWLSKQGLEVTACDFSPTAINKSNLLASKNQVKINNHLLDVLAHGFPPEEMREQFDWVIGIFIQFANAEQRIKQFESIKALTKKGGRVLVQGYTPKQLEYKTGGPSNLGNLYTQNILHDLFNDWVIEELTEYEDKISEGTGHKGKSALISLIARKPF